MNVFSNYMLYFKNHGWKYVLRRGCQQLGNTVKKNWATLTGHNPVSSIYNEQFYSDLTRFEETTKSAAILVQELISLFKPQSVFDIGCGNGLYLREFLSHGIDSIGVDGSENALAKAVVPLPRIMLFDLREPINLHRVFDLAICIEVAEHLPERAAATLVASVTRHSNRIFFTAAPPGQGGEDHINEQPPDYWKNLFSRHGFVALEDETRKLRDRLTKANVVVWLRSNAMLFINKDASAQ